MSVLDSFALDDFGVDRFGADTLSDLRGAMDLYGIPGAQYTGHLDDMRGDGLDGDGHNYACLGDDAALAAIGWNYDGLGWDPFGAIKKAVSSGVKAVGSVGKAAGSVVRVVAKPVSQIVSKVPIVGTAASKYVNIASQMAYNPLALTNPKRLLADTKELVKATVPLIPMAREIVNSPLVQVGVMGAAIVFPPVGVPAAAALATVAAVTKGLDSYLPAVRAAAEQVVKNTAQLANEGNQGAAIALAQMVTQKGAAVATRLTTPGQRPTQQLTPQRRALMQRLAAAKRHRGWRFNVMPSGRIAQQAI